MITFAKENIRFRFRVVGIVLHKRHVLIHRAENDDFWSLPGGRAELLETAEESLQREMREELNVNIKVIRLLWLMENFFELDYEKNHEIAFYFLMEFPEDAAIYQLDRQFHGREHDFNLIFKWHPVKDLVNITLYPSFLQKALTSIPLNTQHVIQNDLCK